MGSTHSDRASLPLSTRSGWEQHTLPGVEKTEPWEQQGGQGAGSGTSPGRCCSHRGGANSPKVPLPRLSPQCGASGSHLRHHCLQPPASAAPAIYTRLGRRAPIARQPRNTTAAPALDASLWHGRQPQAACPGPGRPRSTRRSTAPTALCGTQTRVPVGTGVTAAGTSTVPSPEESPVTGSPALRLHLHPPELPRGREPGLPVPVLAPRGAATTQLLLLLLPACMQPQGAAGRLQPPPANKQRTASPLSAGTVLQGRAWGWGTLALGVPSAGWGPGCAPCAGANTKGSYFYWESSRGWRRIWRAAC